MGKRIAAINSISKAIANSGFFLVLAPLIHGAMTGPTTPPALKEKSAIENQLGEHLRLGDLTPANLELRASLEAQKATLLASERFNEQQREYSEATGNHVDPVSYLFGSACALWILAAGAYHLTIRPAERYRRELRQRRSDEAQEDLQRRLHESATDYAH